MPLFNIAGQSGEISEEQWEKPSAPIFSLTFLWQNTLPHLQDSAIINYHSITAYRGVSICWITLQPRERLFLYNRWRRTWRRRVSGQWSSSGTRLDSIDSASFRRSCEAFGEVPIIVPLSRMKWLLLCLSGYGDYSYVTGQIIHVNGGEVMNGNRPKPKACILSEVCGNFEVTTFHSALP